MRTLLPVGALVIGAALVAASALPSRAQNAGPSGAVHELSWLLAEQKEIILKVRQSVAQRDQYERQLKELDEQSATLKSVWDAIEARRPSIRKLCSGKVPVEKLAAAKEHCDAALQPFNRQVEDHNAKKGRVDTRRQLLQQQDAERAAATVRLEARGEYIKQRIAVLEVALGARQAAPEQGPNCAERCGGKSGEAAVQCVQSCLDNARGDKGTEQGERSSFAAASQQPPRQPIADHFDSLVGTARPTPQQTIIDHFGRIQGNGLIKQH